MVNSFQLEAKGGEEREGKGKRGKGGEGRDSPRVIQSVALIPIADSDEAEHMESGSSSDSHRC